MRLVSVGLAFLLGLAGAAPLAAQSIVTNHGFDTDTAGWILDSPSVTAARSPLDAGGSSSSGSALLTSTTAAERTAGGLRQCVAVTPGVSYQTRLAYRVPSGQARTGSVSFWFFWYPGAGCTGSSPGGSGNGSPLLSTFDTWQTMSTPVTPPAGTASAMFSVAIRKEQAGGTWQAILDEIAVGPVLTATIPASASIHGLSGAFFHTDLWMVNRSAVHQLAVWFRHRCPVEQTCGTHRYGYAVPQNGSLLFSDALKNIFADLETSGAIEIEYESGTSPLVAISRTYSPSQPSPTSGSTVPALAADQAATTSVLPGLAASGGNLTLGFRTNAGAYNPGDTSVNATFTLFSEAGVQIGNPVVAAIPARTPVQVNDVFGTTGASATSTSNAYAVVTATAPVFSYATVIDNQSNDSVIVTGVPVP